MKKSLRLLSAMVMALAMFMPAYAVNQLTVFDGDELSNTCPINNVYLDEPGTRTQVIYPAASLAEMKDEVINSIKFFTFNPITVSGGRIKVSVGETSQSSFGGDLTYVEGLTQVATYSMILNSSVVEIVFDNPYLYRGQNLVIETIVEEVASDYCFIHYAGIRPSNYNVMTRGEIEKFLPKTTFDYGVAADYAAKVNPNELTFNTIRAEREDVQTVVLKNIGQNGFTPALSTAAPFSVDQPNALLMPDESLEIPVTFAPTAEGNYTGTLTIDCGQAGILEVALNGTALEAADELIVGDETDYASFVPIYGTDIDYVGTQGQMIYPADMLTDMVGGDIIGLKFFTKDKAQMKGGIIQLSLKIVDQTVFSEAVPATELTAVATVSPELNGTDLEFVFNEPYKYNGGNLLVECLVTEAGVTNYSPTYFYGTPKDENVSLYTSWDINEWATEFVPFMPKVDFTYQKGETPEVIRGDVNMDKNVTIADVTALIDYLLSQNATGISIDAADCNLDRDVTISDVTCLIDFLLGQSWP